MPNVAEIVVVVGDERPAGDQGGVFGEEFRVRKCVIVPCSVVLVVTFDAENPAVGGL